MKRIIVAFVFVVIAAIVFSIAVGQASVGNVRHIEAEFRAILTCQAVAVMLLIPDLIPMWMKRLYVRLRT